MGSKDPGKLELRAAVDSAAFAEQLGIEPDVFRLQWSRTVTLGDAGYVTLALDVDVRELSETDTRFTVTITKILAELERLHQRTEPGFAGSSGRAVAVSAVLTGTRRAVGFRGRRCGGR